MNWKKVLNDVTWWFSGVIVGVIVTATMGWARQIDLTKAGVSLWIFLSVAFCIILLQLVPAIIIFISFMASMKNKKG